MIPARVRSEWSRLRSKGLTSIWAPASQDSSHVGNAGVVVVSCAWRSPLLCLHLLLLSLSLSLIAGGLCGVCFHLRLVGLCTCLFFMVSQGADAVAEQLALTEQLFDTALE